MNKYIPQYDKDELWKDIDYKTGEEFPNSVPTQYIFENYARYSLYYSFSIKNEHWHEHDFPSVLKRCFDYPESFNLTEEDKKYYTNDQIEFLNRLQKQCLEDELKDIMIDNEYVISELEKRNYQTIINNLKEDKY